LLKNDATTTNINVSFSNVYNASGTRFASPTTGVIQDLEGNTRTISTQVDNSTKFFQSTDATALATGSVQLAGGMSVAKSVYIGSTLVVGSSIAPVTPNTSIGSLLYTPSSTLTDQTTASNGTNSQFNAIYIAPTTLAATNSNVVTTSASTLTIGNAPTAGTNQTFTNSYALNILGGISRFASDVIVGTTYITPNSGDIIKQISFAATSPQVSAANVTGLSFSGIDAISIILSIKVVATTNQYALYDIKLLNKGSAFTIYDQFTGDSIGVVFSVTTAGQVQYTSPTITGLTSMTFKFRANTLQ
jgi:hypothetical protein